MENLRTYNIHALLVIGGFEVRLHNLGHCGVAVPKGGKCGLKCAPCAGAARGSKLSSVGLGLDLYLLNALWSTASLVLGNQEGEGK